MRKKEPYKVFADLKVTCEFPVRFSETDPLGIVWHGNYIKYFEEGREAYGRTHGISYLDVQAAGYTTPIVKTVCEHKKSLKYGDRMRVETQLVDTPAAKMIFLFKIFNEENELVCEGESTQVFVDKEGDLCLTYPEFFENWRNRILSHGLHPSN